MPIYLYDNTLGGNDMQSSLKIEKECPQCQGCGKIDHKPCSACNGKGNVLTEEGQSILNYLRNSIRLSEH